MQRFLSPALLLLSLAACSGGDRPRAAAFVPPAPAESDFGDLRVRYNALPTLALNQAVADQYGVKRDARNALVVVALRQLRDGEESSADGEVELHAVDLAGARQQVALRAVRSGDYTDHIGVVRVSAHDSYRFEARIKAGERRETVKFQRNF